MYREIRSLQERLSRLPRGSAEAGKVEERLDRLIVEYLRLQEMSGDPYA